eukprot:TRINITY_DN11116_c0_g1_i1.p1 TRINITY_DN11116_c0_g1~~TRINITY_DN11116_c0_g1_i1.p1  ORF type:complete len:486 (+),score=133.16 TRINITY_DN11116_c0_g1_i1:94-1458(+)
MDWDELLGVSALAMARVLLVFAAGALLGRFPRANPLLGPKLRGQLGRLVFKVFWPVITFATVAQYCDIRRIGRWWPVPVWCIVTLGVSCAVASLLRPLVISPERDAAFGLIFVVAGTFPNSAGLPILVTETLCSQHDELKAIPDCREMCIANAMLFTVPWYLAMFGVAAPRFAAPAAPAASASYAPAEATVPTTPPQLQREGTACSAAQLHRDPGAPAELAVCPDPSPPANGHAAAPSGERDAPPPAAAAPANGTLSAPPAAAVAAAPGQSYWHALCSGVKTALTDPCVVATYTGIAAGSIPPLREALASQPLDGTLRTIGEPAVACAALITAAALVPPPGDPASGVAQPLRRSPPPLTVAALCLAKLVVVPAALFGLAHGAQSAGFAFDLDRVARLVVLLEFAMPSAQTAVVLLAAAERHAEAAELSAVYVVQYPLAILSLTLASAVALKMSA